MKSEASDMEYSANINLRLTPRMKLIVQAMANVDGNSQQQVIRAAIASSYSKRSRIIDTEIAHIEGLHKMREGKV